MAASPMAALPVISTLVTIYLYRHFGAHQSTGSTAGTIAAVVKHGGLVTGSIEIFRYADGTLGAERDAKLAALAKFPVNLYVSFSNH